MGAILVGIVGAAHGIKGEVRVKSYTADPAAVGTYGPLHVEGRPAPLRVQALRPLKDDMLVVRFEGVTSREAAEGLRGLTLSVDRSALPAADKDEFYHADLIGLPVVDDDGAPVGRVRGLADYGGGDLLDIERPGREGLLVAFTRAFVPVVDVAGGRVVVTAAALAGAEADGPEDRLEDGEGANPS